VVAVDNLNAYYDPKLKSARLALLEVDVKRFVDWCLEYLR
jgi:hypothetical protein